jgi:ketosteroid isomerase-like protein
MRGSTWAGEWRGKESVRRDLLRPLLDQFETVYTNTPRRIFADGDFVIVECKGNVMTKTGKRYDNDYCFVIEMRNGKMIELTEYLDTALVNEALGPMS